MAESPKHYRDSCRRLHRTAAHYFAVRAWCSGADCVVLDRPVVERLFDVERLRGSREEWLRDDMKPWFPHIESLKYQSKNKIGSLYLSRYPIEKWMTGNMTDEARIERMRAEGLNAILFDNPSSFDCSELEMVAELTLLATGLKQLSVPKKPKRASA